MAAEVVMSMTVPKVELMEEMAALVEIIGEAEMDKVQQHVPLVKKVENFMPVAAVVVLEVVAKNVYLTQVVI